MVEYLSISKFIFFVSLTRGLLDSVLDRLFRSSRNLKARKKNNFGEHVETDAGPMASLSDPVTSGQYSVRIRVHTSQDSIGSIEKSINFENDGLNISVTALGAESLKDTTKFSVCAKSFESRSSAEKFSQILARAISLNGVINQFGFDLGKNRPVSRVTDYGLAQLSEANGVRVLNDVHGILVYEELPTPKKFVSGQVSLVVARDERRFRSGLDRALALSEKLTAKQILAIDLYNTSFFEAFPVSRFLTLITVVECLAQTELLENEICKVISALEGTVATSQLNGSDMNYLKNRVSALKYESISRACNKLVSQLLGPAEVRNFKRWYGIRSRLVHNGTQDSNVSQELLGLQDTAGRLILAHIECSGTANGVG